MGKVVAIIAPFIDSSQYNMDFTLRLRKNDRELTLAAFYEWAGEGFRAENISRGVDYGDDIPAAGFYLQGVLHQNGYETVLTNKYDIEALRSLAQKDLFAICVSTTMIITTSSLMSLLDAVKKEIPGVPVIAGGMFIWKSYIQYQNHLADPVNYPLRPEMLFHPGNLGINADVMVVAQHGVSSLIMILSEMGKRRKGDLEKRNQGEVDIMGDLGNISNLCFKRKDEFVFTKRLEENVNYDEDFTRWDLISEMPDKVPVMTSIGCPYRCRFCDFCRLYPKVIYRSKESLSKELNLIKKSLGSKLAVLHVTDDNVFATKKRLFDVCGAISESGLTHWVGFMRGGEYSEEEMKAIMQSGLMMGKIGVESGDQGQLDRMNKKQKAEKVKRGIEQLDAHGISMLLTFVVGFPGETSETLENTAMFLNSLSLENLSLGYQVYPLSVMPLSELAEPEARRKWNIKGVMDHWSHFTMNSTEAVTACHELFRKVTRVPYSYSEESYFFNRGMFDYDSRLKLFKFRQELTVKLTEGAPGEQITPILKEMTSIMELPLEGIHDHLKDEIIIPSK